MRKIWLTAETVRLLQEEPSVVSFDLGITFEKPDKRLLAKIPMEQVKGEFVYCWDGKELLKVAVFDKHLYRLRMIKGAPVLEIDGLRMQLVGKFDSPRQYASEVVHALAVCKEDLVLDTCMGLGYTAIAAAKQGAHVKTYEVSRAVYGIAKWNPYSAALFEGKEIEAENVGVVEALAGTADSTFTAIVHDPPRLSVAGELYSLEFYKEMHRVAKEGCRLFHYVGTLGKSKGRRIEEKVGARLSEAGWQVEKYVQRLQGLIAKKKSVSGR